MPSINAIRQHIRGPRTIYASRWLTDSGDQSANLAAAWASVLSASGRVQFVVDPGTYALASPRNLLELRSNVEIILDGAEFTVDAGVSTAGWDLSATDSFQYDNAIFYALTPSVSDIVVYGGRFVIGAEELAVFQIGDSVTHTSGSITNGNVRIHGLRQYGGNQLQILSMDDVLLDEVYQEGTWSNGLNFSNSTNVRLRSPAGKRIGVTADYVTWNNCGGIVCKGAQDVTISSPRYEYSGGTCILMRSSNSKPLTRIKTTDLGLKACGASAIEYQVDEATVGHVHEQLSISGGFVKGYQCAPSDTNHSGVQIAIKKTGGSTVRGARISGVQVDYCAPYETFDETSTYVVSGSYNTAKNTAATSVGTTWGVALIGVDSNSVIYNGQIDGNSVTRSKNGSVLATHFAGGQVQGNSAEWGGWGRNTADVPGYTVPNAPAHGVMVQVSAELDVSDNTIRRHCPGVEGSQSNRSQLIRCEDSYDTHIHHNNLRGNDTTVAGSAWNHSPIGFSGSGSLALTGYTSRTCSVRVGRNNIFGTYFGLVGADGKHIARQSGATGNILVYDDAFISTTTATSQTVPDGVTTVIAARTTSTQTITLPNPSYAQGQKVLVKHAGLGTGLVTIATAAGTLWPALPVLANVGDFGIWQAIGTVWEQIGGNAGRWATVIPTDTPPLGTVCRISPPVAGDFIGWVFTSGGWKEHGVIEV